MFKNFLSYLLSFLVLIMPLFVTIFFVYVFVKLTKLDTVKKNNEEHDYL
jgi:uncharacterized membrane protein